ncbi:uncharacterized protein LOC135202118 [Macrobrachium nipponense]|uniref:uncharacterized protein LOC135202118 n=1 Tax=Macrobrachium nipponense TaxID=159736 RepID=UPI0030C8D339
MRPTKHKQALRARMLAALQIKREKGNQNNKISGSHVFASEGESVDNGDKGTVEIPATSEIRKKYVTFEDKELPVSENIVMIGEDKLKKLAEVIVCDNKKCKSKCKVDVKKNHYEVDLVVQCIKCDKIMYECEPKRVTVPNTKKVFTDTNLRMVLSSLMNDIGCVGLKRQSGILGSPPLSSWMFDKYQNALCDAVLDKYNKLKELAINGVFEYYKEVGQMPDENGVIEVDVTYDATWLTRGHKSKIRGVGRGPGAILHASASTHLNRTVRFLATGYSFRSLAFSFRMGKTSVSRIVKEVSEAIWETFQDTYLPYPTEEIWLENSARYASKCDFPNCLGSIDGKHIRIKCPVSTAVRINVL